MKIATTLLIIYFLNKVKAFYMENEMEDKIFYKLIPKHFKFNENTTLVVLIHGWKGDMDVEYYKEIIQAFRQDESKKFVFMKVDWSNAANNMFYMLSKNSCKPAGKEIAKHLSTFCKNHKIELSQIHIIGFGLGGQVAGFIGRYLLKLTDETLGRITALDPAGPFFGKMFSGKNVLSKNDAALVVVIHTNGDLQGYFDPLGHIDIYPNGGKNQPGCPHWIFEHILTAFSVINCSHERSYKYFVEAIRAKEVIATQCDNYETFEAGGCTEEKKINIVGNNLTEKDRGKYFFKTNSESPFIIDNKDESSEEV